MKSHGADSQMNKPVNVVVTVARQGGLTLPRRQRYVPQLNNDKNKGENDGNANGGMYVWY